MNKKSDVFKAIHSAVNVCLVVLVLWLFAVDYFDWTWAAFFVGAVVWIVLTFYVSIVGVGWVARKLNVNEFTIKKEKEVNFTTRRAVHNQRGKLVGYVDIEEEGE